jgi:choline dehydrogenase
VAASFDYIIVGAGSAGCVLANRLSADPQNRVLLLEAGGGYRHPLLSMPLAFLKLMQDPAVNWGYLTEPEPFANNRRIALPRGKILGGSSSINGMVYSRGHPRDYDEWAQLGARGWSYSDVLPYFKRAEGSWRGESAYHGASGPLSTAPLPRDDVLFPAVMATAEAKGHLVADDHHGETAEGFAPAEMTIHNGRRGGTAARYLLPALGRPNLVVLTRAEVNRVVIEGGRATGVEYDHDGQTHVARADREVILSGGAFNSPQLLLLSGVGPADELRAAGVAPVLDLPGVGRNLQDHPITGVGFRLNRPVGFESQLRLDRLALSGLRWLIAHDGPVSRLPITCLAFVRTREGLERPDLKANIYPTGIDSRVWFPGVREGRGHIMSAICVLLRPQSRGWVKLASADPRAKPLIQLNILQDPEDLATLRRSVRQMRDFFATPPIADLITGELWPSAGIESDEDLDAYHRRMVVTAHHGAGTCAMGVGEDAVLDAELKVRGIANLRVADASVMPRVIGGNTNAPVIMIAEKAADLILNQSE